MSSIPDLFCAEHNGTIASFRNLSIKLDDIHQYKKLFQGKKTNWSKYTKVTAATLSSFALTLPVSYWALPIVASHLGASGVLGGAMTGKLISHLSGAALQSASLSALGTTGMATIIAAGAGLGGINGGIISNTYVRELDSFNISRIKPGKEPGIIFINGFLTEGSQNYTDWVDGVHERFPENAWYHIDWDSGTQRELGEKVLLPAGKAAGNLLIDNLPKAIRKLASKSNATEFATLPADLLTNPWFRALNNTQKAGALIADIISRTNRTYILMGHSLGARIIRYILETLATKEGQWISSAILMGGAIDRSDREAWKRASSAVSGKIYNCYSVQDEVLQSLYKTATLFNGDPVGSAPITIRNGKFKNINCSRFVAGHLDWKNKIDRIIRSTNIDNSKKERKRSA